MEGRSGFAWAGWGLCSADSAIGRLYEREREREEDHTPPPPSSSGTAQRSTRASAEEFRDSEWRSGRVQANTYSVLY